MDKKRPWWTQSTLNGCSICKRRDEMSEVEWPTPYFSFTSYTYCACKFFFFTFLNISLFKKVHLIIVQCLRIIQGSFWALSVQQCRRVIFLSLKIYIFIYFFFQQIAIWKAIFYIYFLELFLSLNLSIYNFFFFL